MKLRADENVRQIAHKLDDAIRRGWVIKLHKSSISDRVICELYQYGGQSSGPIVSGANASDALAQALQIVECEKELKNGEM